MEITAALALGRRLMREHGLEGWTLTHDRAKTRAGVCRFTDRTISLSAPLTQLHSPEDVRDTLLHEIAHALVGPEHGHDAVWRRQARAIGSSGQRCVDSHLPKVAGEWVGRCSRGHQVHRHRRPTRVLACSSCGPSFRPEHIFTWTYQGRAVGLGGAYAQELAQLRKRFPMWAAQSRDARTANSPTPGAPAPPASNVIIGPFGADSSGSDSAVRSRLGSSTRPSVLRVGGTVRVLAPGPFHGEVGEVEFVGAAKVQVRLNDALYSVPRDVIEAL